MSGSCCIAAAEGSPMTRTGEQDQSGGGGHHGGSVGEVGTGWSARG